MYPDGNCASTCDEPMLPDDKLEQCVSPCEEDEYYFTPEGNCIDQCVAPFEIVEGAYFTACGDSEEIIREFDKALLDVASRTEEGGDIVIKAGVLGAVLVNPGDPGGLTLMVLVSMLHYIRYIKIDYPENLLALFKSQSKNPIAITMSPEIDEDVKNRFVQDDIPAQFAEYNLHSSFFVNYWKTMISLAIIIGAGFLF